MTPRTIPVPDATWLAVDGWGRTSMIDGWLPWTLQLAAALVLAAAVVGRSRHWWIRRMPLIICAGLSVTLGVVWFVYDNGLAGEPAPVTLWAWAGLTAMSVLVFAVGWLAEPWWRRTTALFAVPLCALATIVVFNTWVGYARTAEAAWKFATGSTPPNQADLATVRKMADDHIVPEKGRVVPVSTGSAGSGFQHRGELVYLPPVWFTSSPPPPLPVVMMIGGEFGSSADWLWAGDAQKTADDFARSHGGSAPILVFADKGGAFNQDTECVNGNQGNAADHLTKDVVPSIVSSFGTSTEPSNWAVAGWSMGGTCAVMLATKYPQLFSTFVDIEGDAGPTVGTRQQTIDRLFRGSEDAWEDFDPATVMRRHGPYHGLAGAFVVETPAQGSRPSRHVVAAQDLSAVANEHGIATSILEISGKHDWPTGAAAFAQTFEWIASRIHTPGITATPMPMPMPMPGSPSNASAEPGGPSVSKRPDTGPPR